MPSDPDTDRTAAPAGTETHPGNDAPGTGTVPQTPAVGPTGTVPGPDGPPPAVPGAPTIEGYDIEAELGRGAMGVVYLARHTKLNRRAAVKVILGGQFQDAAARVRFQVEAEAVAQVEHPHVVQLYEFGQAGDQPFFALEYVPGGTLAARLKKAGGRLPPGEAAVVVATLAGAVAAAHAKGVVHRDLKPANVLLTADGQPKVADFGLAKVGGSDLTASNAMMGTPAYMAPEQAAGKAKQVGTPADVWALGVILYECLTGAVPYRGDTVMDTLFKVVNDDPARPRSLDPKIPRDLETICLKCLQKDPAKRYPAAAALEADLRAYLAGRPIAARPVGPAERAWKWAKRHPARAVAAAAGVLLIAGAAVAANEVQKQRERDRIAADEESLRKQREARAGALVQALTTSDPAGVPRLLADLAEVRDLATPRLAELAGQPVGTRPGLHARLALLAVDPGRAKEVAAYLPGCRPDELLPARQLLAPHAAAAAPPLWAVLTDDKADPGRRLRAACALAGLAPGDGRWKDVAPAVAGRVVRENPLEAAVWAQALEPVRAALLPELVKLYPAARRKIEAGKLAVSELAAEASAFDLTANLLARYEADRPAELAESAVTVDARHHALFAAAIAANRAAVIPVLNAELAKTVAPDWRDKPLDPAWTPVPADAAKQVEAALGLVHDRFAFVQSLPLAAFEPLAAALAPAGYRPVRVRPYETADGLKVAAVWRRDGGGWKFLAGATAGEVRAADAEHRAAGFQPADAAMWPDPDAKPGPIEPPAAALGGAGGWHAATRPMFRFAAVWEATAGGKPASQFYLGPSAADHQRATNVPKAARLVPLTVHAVTVPGRGTHYAGVWGKAAVSPGSVGWERTEASYRAGRANAVAADVAAVGAADGKSEYAAVWHSGLLTEAEQPTGLAPADHLAGAKELAAAGWRVVGLSLTGEPPAGGGPLAASVWHRPLVPDAALDALAKRRANAAAVLLTLGEADPVWPLLKHAPDPSARSYLVARLAGVGLDPLALIRQFRVEPDVSARRAVLIALGEYAPAAVPAVERDALTAELLALYRGHPDPGLHSAIDWLLKQRWGKATELAAIDAELAAAAKGAEPAKTDKDWFVNGEGQTFAVLRGPVEFVMGSPPTEPGRTDENEPPHRKRVGRTFAVATKEVTVEQFLRFRPGHSWTKRYSPDPDSPAVSITWYDAAEYCNWLSEKAGIPREQWCYAPNPQGRYNEGMTIKPGHLSLTGYRLPTEAEWEAACRAGTVTARYYGRGEELLPRFGWYPKNADGRAWPVGRLRPSDMGLFDSLGNALEWVEDRASLYNVSRLEDIESKSYLKLDARENRVLRGGSFDSTPAAQRGALRGNERPGNRSDAMGVRPARTLP